jgi:2-dehydropantoate 2-reductase
MFKRIAVLGAGAIGGWIAAKLHMAQAAHPALGSQGAEIHLITRGAALQALKANGLTLLSDSQHYTLKTPWETADFYQKSGQTFDLIVVAIKSQGMAQAARDIAPLMHRQTALLTAMNGVPWWFMPEHPLQSVDPGAEIAALIPREQIMGCVVHASCSTEAPGVVRHRFGNGLILGEAQGGTSERLDAAVKLFREAGFEASASNHIQRDIWFKLWGNMTMNPISALTGATADKVLDDPLVRQFASAVMLEAQAVGERIGIPIAQTPDDRHAMTRKLGALKTSMLQDTEAGRSIELDALVTAVFELGQRVGMQMPSTAALLGLTRLMAQQRGLYANS